MNYRINLKHLLFIFIIFTTAAFNVFAGPEVQISDNLEIDPNDYVIENPKDVDAKIKAIAHKDKSNFSVQVTLPTLSFVIPHPTAEQMEFYQNLSEADKVKFHAKRLIGLKVLAAGLTSIKKGLGFGSLVKEKIMFWKKKTGPQINFNDRSDKVVEGIIRKFDATAWESAPVFAELKEIGVTGTAQVVAALGTNKRIDFHKEIRGKKVDVVLPELKSGGAIGVGFTIGINFEQKSLVFQLFNANEQLKEVYLPLIYLAGNLKGGMYLSSDREKLYSTQKGEGFYPFAAPGYSESAPSKKSFGGTFAVGLPTSPIDAGLTFKTSMQEQSYLSIRLSPFTWKFISINMKNPLGIMKIGVKNIPALFIELGRIYQQIYYARSCKGLYL